MVEGCFAGSCGCHFQLGLAQQLDNLVGELVAMGARARRHQVAVHHHILVGVDGAHVLGVAVQVGMAHQRPSAHQLRNRRDQPQAVTDDALEDARLGKRALDELHRRRGLAQGLAVAKPIRDKSRRDDDRLVGSELLVAHALEALVTLKWHLVLVAGECQPRLAPQTTEPVHLDAFLGEAVLVVEDFFLVEIAFDQNADFFAFEAHYLAPCERQWT